MKSVARAFALVAVAIMLGQSAVATASDAVVRAELEGRVSRATEAVQAVAADPSTENLAAVRAAIDDLPPALRSSPALREMEAAMQALEDPLVQRLLLPLLRAGAFGNVTQPQVDRVENAVLTARDRIGLDHASMSAQVEATRAAIAGLDLRDEASFRAGIEALSDDEVAGLLAQMSAFSGAWSGSSDSALADDMAETIAGLSAHSPGELRADVLEDPALAASYQRTMLEFQAIAEDLQAELEAELAATPMSAEDAEMMEAFRGALVGQMQQSAQMMGLDQDAFFGIEAAQGPAYQDTRGPLAIDGKPVVDVSAAVSAAQPAAPVAPRRLVDPALAASTIALPGARGVSFPTGDCQAAPIQESGGYGPWGTPFSEGDVGATNATARNVSFPGDAVCGRLEAPGDALDVYRLVLPPSSFVRIFIEYAEHNADLHLEARAEGGALLNTWSSLSDNRSYRPFFDGLTFVNDDELSAAELLLNVSTDGESTANITYLLRADTQPYDPARICERGEADCGLSWLKWGDSCYRHRVRPTLEDWSTVTDDTIHDHRSFTKCREREGANVGNSATWANLSHLRENPVVFIHGVGSDSGVWLAPEAEGFFAKSSINGHEFFKLKWRLIIYGVLGTVTTLILLNAARDSYAFWTIGGALARLYAVVTMIDALCTWLTIWYQVTSALEKGWGNWRVGDSVDEKGHFWTMKDSGFEVYWLEYNYNDNNARTGQLTSASRQVKFGISAIQQDFYDRHKGEPGFPYPAPEDVRVDIVSHSNGGLASRLYTVDNATVTEGTYVGPVYEADVNKLIQIQTPNMGSSVAKAAVEKLHVLNGNMTQSIGQLVAQFMAPILGWLLGIATEIMNIRYGSFLKIGCGPKVSWTPSKPCIGGPGQFIAFQLTVGLIAFAGYWWLKGKAEDLAVDRAELIRDHSDILAHLNALPPAPDVDHGAIYGDAFDASILDLGHIDGLVAVRDVIEGPIGQVASYTNIANDHGSSLHSTSAKLIVRLWLLNRDGSGLSRIPIIPPAGASAATVAMAEDDAPSLLRDFGQAVPGASETPGARYSDGSLGSVAGDAPTPPLGERDAKLQRLASLKGLDATGAAAASNATREAADDAIDANNTDGIENATNAIGSTYENVSADPASHERVRELGPDVAVLRSGHEAAAAGLLDHIGEPYVTLDTKAAPSELAKRRVLLVPTGALAGFASDRRLAEKLDGYVESGGTLLVLAQQRGADLAALPGAPQGFGFAEEDAVFRASVVLGDFSPDLAGQTSPTPDLHVDGSFTQLPDDASVLLRNARNGRPVAASYAWGDGRVYVVQSPLDWAFAASRGTLAEARLVRDILASGRAPDAQLLGAPGAPADVHVELDPGAATNVTLVLVDAHARDAHRETLPAATSYGWSIPANATGAGVYAVDAILRDENGTTLGRRYAVAHGYAAAFAASPDGFRAPLADATLDVTSASDRAERGQPQSFTLHVANNADRERTLSVGWWYPEHAANATDPATYGAGPARDGAPAAWADNFRLRADLALAPGASATVPATIVAQRADALVARLYEGGELLAEASRRFVAYDPTVAIAVATDKSVYAAGETARVQLSARDAAAPAGALGAMTRLAVTLRAPDGTIAASGQATLLVSGVPAHANVTLALPASAASGSYLIQVEAFRDAQRVGSAAASLRVPDLQLAMRPILPASLAQGSASPLALALRNTGARPITDATLDVRIETPTGALSWSDVAAFSLAPGEETQVGFSATPASAALGDHRLRYVVQAENETFEGSTTLRSSLSRSIGFSQATYRARDELRAIGVVRNDGRFVLDGSATLAADLGAPASSAFQLAPGEATSLELRATIPGAATPGERAVDLTVSSAGGALSSRRTFTVPPAQASLQMPTFAPARAADVLAVPLANGGGVDAPIPWTLDIEDARGLRVAVASGVATVPAGGSASIEVAIPPQAATGSYRVAASAETSPGRPAVAVRGLEVAGTAGSVALAAPSFVAPGAAVGVQAVASSTGEVALEGASFELVAVRPTPLPAWSPLDGIADATSAVEHDGALWFGTSDGLLRRDPDGIVVRVAASLPSPRVTALASALGALHVGTDAGLASFDGAAWTTAASVGHVLSLAGTEDALFVAGDRGTFRLDGAGLRAIALPAPASRALAADRAELWVALTQTYSGFTGEDAIPFAKEGSTRPQPAIAVAPDGTIHLAYVDNATSETRVLHRALAPDGTPMGPARVLAAGPGSRSNPAIGAAADSTVRVAWSDTRNGDSDVYARKLDARGEPISPEIAVAVDAGTAQTFPRVAMLPDGSTVLVWADNRFPNPPEGPGRRDEVMMARLAPDGSIAQEPVRLTDVPTYVLRPAVAAHTDGTVHVAWTGTREWCDPEFPDICFNNLETFYGKFAADGAPIVDELLVSVGDDQMSWLPQLTVDASGAAHVVYQESRPQTLDIRYARVVGGALHASDVGVSPAGMRARYAEIHARGDGRFDVVWGAATTHERAYHGIFDPVDQRLVGAPTRVSADVNATVVFAPTLRSARAPSGTLVAIYEDPTTANGEVRLAVGAVGRVGRGLARVDLGSGAITRLDAASSALPTDDVRALALEGGLLAAATSTGLLVRSAAGEISAFDLGEPPTSVAVRNGVAYAGVSAGLVSVDARASSVQRVDAGGPGAPRALAPSASGLVAAGASSAALLRDDRDDVIWRAMAEAPADVSFTAPGETGRIEVRATLLAQTGQALAQARRSVHVLEGSATVALQPTQPVFAAGSPAETLVTVANRGTSAWRDVRVVVEYGDARALDAVTSLAAGEARTFLASAVLTRSSDVVARVHASPVAAAGAGAELVTQARDHVRVEAPRVMARIEAPDVAPRGGFEVAASITNAGAFPARLTLALDGARSFPVTVPSRTTALVPLGTREIADDATLRLVVGGDVDLLVEKSVRVAERATIAGLRGASGPAGERAVTLDVVSQGARATEFDAVLRLDGAPAGALRVALASGASAARDATLTLAEGVHSLEVATPWETRTFRLVAAERAIPLLTIDGVDVGSNVSVRARLENAGPGQLAGTLRVGHGFDEREEAILLGEGETLERDVALPLAGLTTGPATAAAQLVRDGAPAASAERAYAVPPPSLRIVSAELPAAAQPGDTLALRYLVENVGVVRGPAELVVRAGAGSEERRPLALAPGERATVDLTARVELDASEGPLDVAAAVPGDRADRIVHVSGARVNASASLDAAAYAPLATANVTVQIENPGPRALALVVRASYASSAPSREVTLAAGEARAVALPIAVRADGDARWTVESAAGRQLATGVVFVKLDRLAAQGIRIVAPTTATASSTIDVTVTTSREGRVDLLGPGFDDEFVLNGTTTRTYLVPATIPSARYTLFWNFDATNASGGLQLDVAGAAVRTLDFALERAAGGAVDVAEAGEALRATWRFESATAVPATLRTWHEDARGSAIGARVVPVQLLAGANALVVDTRAPDGQPGSAAFRARLTLAGDFPLASIAAPYALAGVWLRDVSFATHDGALLAQIEAESATPLDAIARLRVGSAEAASASMRLDPVARAALDAPLPEPGTYPVALSLEAQGRTYERTAVVSLPGRGEPPVTTLLVRGPNLTRADGVLVLGAGASLELVATDAGSGVEATLIEVDDRPLAVEGEFVPAPGLHELRFQSRDRAGNLEPAQRQRVLMDVRPPTLEVVSPEEGSVHVAGASQTPGAPAPVLVLRPPGEVDADGDGYTDADETAEGSDPADAASVPARWSPAPPPSPDRPVVVAGALRVAATAEDHETGRATIRVLVGAREVASGENAGDWTVDVSGLAAGDHELRILAEDAVGNVAQRVFRLLVVPASAEGVDATLADDPRYPPWARLALAWAQEGAAGWPDAAAGEAEARAARALGAGRATYAREADPLVPPVVRGLPDHAERETGRVEDALEECGCGT